MRTWKTVENCQSKLLYHKLSEVDGSFKVYKYWQNTWIAIKNIAQMYWIADSAL